MTLQPTATHCNTLQHTATHCNTLQHTATHCNTLQHTATHCNTLQHTATRDVSLSDTRLQSNTAVSLRLPHCYSLQHTATRTAIHCNACNRESKSEWERVKLSLTHTRTNTHKHSSWLRQYLLFFFCHESLEKRRGVLFNKKSLKSPSLSNKHKHAHSSEPQPQQYLPFCVRKPVSQKMVVPPRLAYNKVFTL